MIPTSTLNRSSRASNSRQKTGRDSRNRAEGKKTPAETRDRTVREKETNKTQGTVERPHRESRRLAIRNLHAEETPETGTLQEITAPKEKERVKTPEEVKDRNLREEIQADRIRDLKETTIGIRVEVTETRAEEIETAETTRNRISMRKTSITSLKEKAKAFKNKRKKTKTKEVQGTETSTL